MGQKNSVPKSQDTEKAYSIKHPKFNNIKFLKDPHTDEQYFQTAIPIVTQKQYDIWVKRLNQIPSKSEALMLPKSYKFEKQGLCGSNGVARIDFENYPFLLSDQIVNRQSINHKQFQENQLWYLLFTLISAAKDFHLQGRKVGDIRPQNIFINEDGQIKIASQYSVPGQQINYSKTFYERQITYLSPQQMKDIQFGKMQSSQPYDISQSFSIGLTVLDAALLSDSLNIYLKNGKFDFTALDQKLKNLRKVGYSELLTITVYNLCETEGVNRSTSNQIYQWLIPFEDYIFNLEEFQVSHLPPKIAATRDKMNQQQQPNNNSNVRPNLPLPVIKNNQQNVNYIPPNLPVTQSHYVQQIRPVYQQQQQNIPVRTVVNQLQKIPPPFLHEVNPSNRIISQQTIQGGYTTVNQPINQNYVQNVNKPIQGNYTVVNPIPVQRIVGGRPNLSQPPSYEQIQIKQPTIQKIPESKANYQIQGNTGKQNEIQQPSNDITNQYTIALEKIDQQLKMSRKLFPS